jgi:hypothetical protein
MNLTRPKMPMPIPCRGPPSSLVSRHRVEELALAGVQSDDSVAVLPKCRPISGGTKRRGLRWRPSSPQERGPKKDAGPLSEKKLADSSSTSPLLLLVVKFLQPLLLCNEKSAHSYILTTSTSYDFSSLTPFPLFAAVCAPLLRPQTSD